MHKSNTTYSVIIPTLNEEKNVEPLLVDLNEKIKLTTNSVEIIIVDGGSTDNTIDKIKQFNVKLLHSIRGRGQQFKFGAENSCGEILIFQHADSILPEDAFTFLDKYFTKHKKAATFRMKYDINFYPYTIFSFFTRFDSIFSTFGDQGLIIQKEFYEKIGGFNNLMIMEDVDILKKIRKEVRITKFKKYIISSSRKLKNNGIIKSQITSFVLIIMYLLGINIETLYEIYYKKNDQEKSNNNIHKISRIRKGQDQISLNNE
ncbi:TIGR04283 family arsenosugar biosynthesis glycosyltransferase [Candidatus Woesearchaeota archaeon]|nr:TIGR04283 family arsenosugar biosynthesis glycosyltransferase [Candidatus Woesearchaeota archaeon]